MGNKNGTARTKPQLATGPQKCVVLGPTGLFQNARIAAMIALACPRPDQDNQRIQKISGRKTTIEDRSRPNHSRFNIPLSPEQKIHILTEISARAFPS